MSRIREAGRLHGPAMAWAAGRCLALSLLLLGAGCARTPPARYYVLDAPAGTLIAGERTGPLLGLGPLTLPGYLDRPQIVTRNGEHQLQLLSQDRWAEPFAESFERLLRARLAAALPEARVVGMPWKAAGAPTRRVALQVERLDRGADGNLVLVARWTVAEAEQPAGSQHVSNIAVPAGADTASLGAAHSTAIGTLAAEIAAAVR